MSSKTAQAYKWNSLSQVVNQILLFCINLILVRMLSPQDFGIVTLPFIFFSMVRLIQDLGYADVLIKSSADDKELHSSVFWLIVVLGGILSLVYFSAHHLFSTANAKVILIYSICLVIGSFGIGYESILKREMAFKDLFYADIAANILSGIVAIMIAYKGYEWIALLARTFIQYGISLMYYIWKINWKPMMVLNLPLLKSSKTFAFINIFDQIMAYLSKNIDTYIIGLKFDILQLGLYDRAYKLINLPVQQTTGALSKVMLPEMTANDMTAENRLAIVRRNILISSFIIIPTSMYMYLNAECIVDIIFGRKWEAILPIFKIFALSAWFQTLLSLFNPYMASRDHNRDYFRYSLISKFIIIIGMVTLSLTSKNLSTIAFGYFILNVIVSFIILWLMQNKYCKGLIDSIFLKEFGKIILSIAVCLAVHLLCDRILDTCSMRLVLLFVVDVVIYFTTLSAVRSKALSELKSLVLS